MDDLWAPQRAERRQSVEPLAARMRKAGLTKMRLPETVDVAGSVRVMVSGDSISYSAYCGKVIVSRCVSGSSFGFDRPNIYITALFCSSLVSLTETVN